MQIIDIFQTFFGWGGPLYQCFLLSGSIKVVMSKQEYKKKKSWVAYLNKTSQAR